MTSEVISKLNAIAAENFEKAQAMLEGINLVLGSEYGWLAKKLVFFDDTSSVVAKYTSVMMRGIGRSTDSNFFTQTTRK